MNRVSKQGTATLLKVINCHNTLGENVLWHALEQAIYWIDIEKAEILRYHPESAALCRYSLPERIGSFAFLAPDDTHEFDIIAAFASGFNHLSYFNRLFKAYFGKTPRQFAKD